MDLAILSGIYKNPDKTDPNYARLTVQREIALNIKSAAIHSVLVYASYDVPVT